MNQFIKLTSVVTALLLFSACGGDSGDSGTLKDIQELNITNSDNNSSMLATDTKSLISYVIYDDGSFSDTTSNVIWESSEANVTAGDSITKGEVSLLSNYNGLVTISTSFKQFTASYNVNIDGISHLNVTPSDHNASGAGDNFQLDARALFISGADKNITQSTVWSSSDTTIATVDTLGYVNVLSSGDFNITATTLGESNTSVITNH